MLNTTPIFAACYERKRENFFASQHFFVSISASSAENDNNNYTVISLASHLIFCLDCGLQESGISNFRQHSSP